MTERELQKLPFGVPLWYVEWNPGNGSAPVARVVPVTVTPADADRERRAVYYTTREGARRLANAVRCHKSERDAHRELYRRARDLRNALDVTLGEIERKYGVTS